MTIEEDNNGEYLIVSDKYEELEILEEPESSIVSQQSTAGIMGLSTNNIYKMIHVVLEQ